jgi:hypothetical protein
MEKVKMRAKVEKILRSPRQREATPHPVTSHPILNLC